MLNQKIQALVKETKKLMDECNVELRIIIAPPRTNSTAIEASFYMNDAVTANSNEIFKATNDEIDFETSIKLLQEDIKKAQREDGKGILVLKDMSIWINGAVEYLHELTDYPILFLIRNPILSMESRMNKYLQKLPISNQSHIHKWILEKLQYQKELTPAVQISFFDDLAKAHGFNNWIQFLEHMKLEGNYSYIFELIENVFPERHSGFDEINQQIAVLKQLGLGYRIVDSSELRLHPKEMQKELCSIWNLPYTEQMIEWGEAIEKFSVTNRVKFPEIWFGRLLQSSGIEPPTEIPLNIGRFPEKVKRQLIESDIPFYHAFATDIMRLSIKIPNDTVVEIDTEVAIARGLITRDNTPKDGTISIPYRLIDPETAQLMNYRKHGIEGNSKKSKEVS